MPFDAIFVSIWFHKDYSSFIPIQISVSDDKLYVANIGTLPEEWTLEKLLGKHSSRPHNPTIASCVYLTDMIETWGRGIRKVLDECARHGCPPPVYEVDAGDPGDIQVRIDAAPDAIVRDTNADVNDPSRDTNDTNLDTNDTNLDANAVRDGRSAESGPPPLILSILEMIRANRRLTIGAMAEMCHVSRPHGESCHKSGASTHFGG